MNDENNTEIIQKKYMEYYILNEQLKKLSEQIAILENQSIELRNITDHLDTLSKIKKETPIFASLGPGLFIKATIQNNENIIMNVGADIIVKKSIKDAKEYINSQLDEIDKILLTLDQEVPELIKQEQNLKKELKELSKKE